MSLFRQTQGHSPYTSTGRVAMLAIPLAVALVACGAKDGAPAAGGPGGGMPPAEVGVVTVAAQSVALQSELPGRVSAVRVAQVRARVNGVVLQRLFREGSEVKAGQVLYQIDSAPYRASLESAEASVAKAQANVAQTTAQAERYKPLMEANAVSKQEYTTLVTAQRQAEADLSTAKAAVQTARINLNYANITAPISGRIGQSLVTEGALVSATEATQMAVIQQTGTVYVNFTQSSTDVLRLRKAIASKQLRASGDGSVPVRVVLEDGTELAKPGKLLFSDLTVDASSGQITLRAEVPNTDGLLLPGQYVRVRLSQAELPSAVLLPQQAVTRTNQGDSVLVVGEGGKPGPRPVKVGNAQNNQWVILDGLKEGDQVIVDGFQKMMVPGAPVKPVPWAGAAPAAAGAPGAAASAPAAAASAAGK
ncbi:MAG: efflux transporter periplasmic adaptor subunit [Curvibacter sp. RIFCSPHIGHO2_12_FULL_63_18]|uniref:efflux RND transporter periplasmic adaptor subunit n=1 Tax=Rhodoferax sp. TaxID=50421 RepID=UPI0008D82C6A|nr:efflux RND transporter periplasmic adaptor subunit [Rhodoferax sp.]OGO98286.1 MAG: efflux transporter periplasmic adaptor subunit [Curvibacter sp. GWA2_63_95]OGP03911.1 MAG: efflux transporter periplasmic adaptor subunit [Curvibacter sp. RIFCSPHIGHO2_12_FULL_63_18]HCX82975.1 efflux transporter periplasmic adaptor subunit [Rhodoferax sp.]